MKYKPELGWFGNLERAFAELTKTNNTVFNTESRISANEEVNNITFVALAETKVLDDDTAARHATVFPEWAVGETFEIVNNKRPMRTDPLNGKLYRLNEGASHKSVEGWNPSLTPALWTVVDVTHAGTKDDPIPAARSMEFKEGLYYSDEEDGCLYLCTRGGTLHYMPHELVGQYFEIV